MTRDVLLAVVIGAQGLKGEVKVKNFTAAPDALRAYGVLHDRNGRRFTIAAVRPLKPGHAGKPGEAAIAFQGVCTREAAEALRGTELFVTRDALPQTDDDEFYHADLIGLEARDADARVLGKVHAIHNFGAGDVIEIASADGDNILLAFTRDTVPAIRIADGYVVVAVPDEDNAGDPAHPDVA